MTERAAELLLDEQQIAAHELDHRQAYLQDCLNSLSEQQKSIVDGYDRMAYSVRELSQQTGKTSEAIYKSLHRIRRVLHDCVESTMRGTEA
ncbi:MAG: sigma factor-like helix-turn-helix DNA-binding protein [Rubripirellula sp.]|nr:sigma factor-like helix-turn-helix DNA-binding protein [Rubripirellula sp.]